MAEKLYLLVFRANGLRGIFIENLSKSSFHELGNKSAGEVPLLLSVPYLAAQVISDVDSIRAHEFECSWLL